MSEELKPCPFCGGAVKMDRHKGSDETGERWDYFSVECRGKDHNVICDSGDTAEEVAASWNRRAPMTALTTPPAGEEKGECELLQEQRDGASEWMSVIGHLPRSYEPELLGIVDDAFAAGQKAATVEWQPIASAPKQRVILLWALTDTETGNWKTATGYWMPGYGDDPGAWWWDGRQLKSYDIQPTHWQRLPEPPVPSPTDGAVEDQAKVRTPSLLSSPSVEEVRREAFEEAAAIAEGYMRDLSNPIFARACAENIAARIRSLSPQGG